MSVNGSSSSPKNDNESNNDGRDVNGSSSESSSEIERRNRVSLAKLTAKSEDSWIARLAMGQICNTAKLTRAARGLERGKIAIVCALAEGVARNEEIKDPTYDKMMECAKKACAKKSRND